MYPTHSLLSESKQISHPLDGSLLTDALQICVIAPYRSSNRNCRPVFCIPVLRDIGTSVTRHYHKWSLVRRYSPRGLRNLEKYIIIIIIIIVIVVVIVVVVIVVIISIAVVIVVYANVYIINILLYK